MDEQFSISNSNSNELEQIPVDNYNLQHSKRSLFPIIILFLGVIFAAIISYLFVQNRFLRSQLAVNSIPSPVASAVTQPSPDPTSDWKVYTNTAYNYSLKNPSDFVVEGMKPGAKPGAVEEDSKGILLYPQQDGSNVPTPLMQLEVDPNLNISHGTYNEWANQVEAIFRDNYELISKSSVNLGAATNVTKLTGMRIYPTHKTPVNVYLFQQVNSGNYFYITIAGDTEQDIKVFDQILSTFQFTEEIPNITLPKEGSVVTSPITISGTVPAGWMFEGQLPIEIRDSQGKVIGRGTAHDNPPGTWSSGKPVNFQASISFTPSGDAGSINLLSDNPSGLPENEKSFSYLVRFR